MSDQRRISEADAHTIIAAQRVLADEYRAEMHALIRSICPGPHEFAQRRDRQPPWCGACRYRQDGYRAGDPIDEVSA